MAPQHDGPGSANERSGKGENVMTTHRIDPLDRIGSPDRMRKITLLSFSLAAMLVSLLPATPAWAIPRTWVSSTGTGTTCTRAAPCASFATAQAATDAGGEINCVDAGEYNVGGLDITKSIT